MSKYRKLAEMAVRSLAEYDGSYRTLNEWSSDIEMPELHREIERENEEKRKWRAQTAKPSEYGEDDDTFFDWTPDGYGDSSIYGRRGGENVYASKKQQRVLDNARSESAAKWEGIKSKIRELFQKEAEIILSWGDESGWEEQESLWDERYKPLEQLNKEAYPFMTQVFSPYGDEAGLSWWLLETRANCQENGEDLRTAFAGVWDEISSYIDRAAKEDGDEGFAKARKSIGW